MNEPTPKPPCCQWQLKADPESRLVSIQPPHCPIAYVMSPAEALRLADAIRESAHLGAGDIEVLHGTASLN